jgi:hypothetical protein
LDKRRFEAYRRRLVAAKKARRAYVDAEIEHLRFRALGSKGALPKKLEAKLRTFMEQHLLLCESTNLKVMNERLPHDENDHYEGDGCIQG